MNNLSYGYSPPNNTSFSSYTSHYSSTPSNNNSNARFQRPRFAYAGPPSYPRPRSSASKPNPDTYLDSMQNTDYNRSDYKDDYYKDGFSDSMRNNYGDSTFTSGLSSTMGSFTTPNMSSNSSVYFTPTESYYPSPQKPMISSYPTYPGDTNKGGLASNFNMGLTGTFASSTRGGNGTNSRGRGNNRGRFQKRGGASGGMNLTDNFMESAKWRCSVCSIIFTSQIPLEMHLRGARHAKKLKAQNALHSLQGQTSQITEIEKADGKKFVCELCNVVANSSLQLQMHLEGVKHKNKLNPPKEGEAGKKTEEDVLNGKSNGGVVRAAPADFAEQPKPTKMSKFSCDICNVIMNSDVQLQQHLTSKKHQAKVEGKPIIKKRKPKEEGEDAAAATEPVTDETATKVEVTNVVGVKTLSASFVQGETLH